jgi:hypothetical protein
MSSGSGNRYFDSKQLFNEPVVEQVNSHMVMSRVVPPLRTRFVSIDTRFRDDYDNYGVLGAGASFSITMPEKISKVRSMKVVQAEVPFSMNNISSSLDNCSVVVKFLGEGGAVSSQSIYTIPNGFYTLNTLKTYIVANPIPGLGELLVSGNAHSSFPVLPFSAGVTGLNVVFSVDASGNYNKYGVKSTLGWLLGFRLASYNFTAGGTTWISESQMDLNGPRYMFLVLDDFQNATSGDTSFISPLYRSIINKNIIARFAAVFSIDGCGCTNNIYRYTEKTGTLVTDTRCYSGFGNLQRLQVSLVDEFGRVMDLDGLDFSFCVQLETE